MKVNYITISKHIIMCSHRQKLIRPNYPSHKGGAPKVSPFYYHELFVCYSAIKYNMCKRLFSLMMKEMIFLGRSGGGGGRSASKKKLYCVCRTPYDNSKFYVGCDLCSNWFHGSCVGITEVRHFLFFNGFTQLNWVLPCSLKG